MAEVGRVALVSFALFLAARLALLSAISAFVSHRQVVKTNPRAKYRRDRASVQYASNWPRTSGDGAQMLRRVVVILYGKGFITSTSPSTNSFTSIPNVPPGTSCTMYGRNNRGESTASSHMLTLLKSEADHWKKDDACVGTATETVSLGPRINVILVVG